MDGKNNKIDRVQNAHTLKHIVVIDGEEYHVYGRTGVLYVRVGKFCHELLFQRDGSFAISKNRFVDRSIDGEEQQMAYDTEVYTDEDSLEPSMEEKSLVEQ